MPKHKADNGPWYCTSSFAYWWTCTPFVLHPLPCCSSRSACPHWFGIWHCPFLVQDCSAKAFPGPSGCFHLEEFLLSPYCLPSSSLGPSSALHQQLLASQQQEEEVEERTWFRYCLFKRKQRPPLPLTEKCRYFPLWKTLKQLESKKKQTCWMSVQKHKQESKKWNLTEAQGRGFLSRLLKSVANLFLQYLLKHLKGRFW